ncbi:hypothetical protein [Rhizobium rhizogenes]|uniref:hypothetical protein n=1 Tax=Rhizobium rhizogenes TaxID=359 RepID=UPI0005A154B7|nr:hypothetical protein [Rhizobium rhizogenes]OCJ18541.1 hypothetical protein A6U88_33125 [Agrobacterium sp. B131/95]OCJ24109.1 hypothetical protein A6U89_31165 [Agrobacterium sp. B133/95]
MQKNPIDQKDSRRLDCFWLRDFVVGSVIVAGSIHRVCASPEGTKQKAVQTLVIMRVQEEAFGIIPTETIADRLGIVKSINASLYNRAAFLGKYWSQFVSEGSFPGTVHSIDGDYQAALQGNNSAGKFYKEITSVVH